MGAATAGRPAGFESWFAEEGAGQVEIDDRADDAQQAIEKAAEEPAFVQDDALSIGAINAAIIAGNAPPKRVERLRAFWEGITAPSSLWPALSSAITGQSRRASSLNALLFGQPGFFAPRPPLHWVLGAAPTSYYETSALNDFGCVTTMDIVELIYRPTDPQGLSKDYEFSRSTMHTRWAQGLVDAQTTLLASPWLAPMPPEVGARSFDVLKDRVSEGAPGHGRSGQGSTNDW